MRIVNYIEHPRLKITIFHYNDAFSVKFEASKMEQTIQFREGEMTDDKAVVTFVNDHVLDIMDKHFFALSSARVDFMRLSRGEEEFDVII